MKLCSPLLRLPLNIVETCLPRISNTLILYYDPALILNLNQPSYYNLNI